MKFLVDAQLPAKLVQLLRTAGHDAIHTSELPEGNRTTDQALARKADGEGRVVVTKDRDFRDGHLLSRSPRHLLVVTTGNITGRKWLAARQTRLGCRSSKGSDAQLGTLIEVAG